MLSRVESGMFLFRIGRRFSDNSATNVRIARLAQNSPLHSNSHRAGESRPRPLR